MTFVRAKREGDWPLHLHVCSQMLSYFFAAGHNNYARYGSYYLRKMYGLHEEVLEKFMKRRREGVWYGIWSDMMIETTFMRYGEGNKRSGGLIGVTIKPETAKR